ncbi:Lst4p KNAG_0C00960 [Huiozyma naganishii CBS 8797]|uniref:Protein LST4 n=1 Tax=Huiozyma naganishii (strain ATCC MYA-139 / BCRC 22969 / CBS 8797 / KCTC 17520 / NBRC 10181 / NCYC 3082 / Yp74L-3) TaxID=1071383 RepID=J7S4B6_HUIN7|nr:hypothetical protein KNAG_0C00960 [Kazachstania naganishii CBS 8797]CCK69209.1 hypothetical protein KNAG_0C00960 [Kazachstania naganishii CBS 8797]
MLGNLLANGNASSGNKLVVGGNNPNGPNALRNFGNLKITKQPGGPNTKHADGAPSTGTVGGLTTEGLSAAATAATTATAHHEFWGRPAMHAPPILDHMADELKFKLLGSKVVPFANTVDTLDSQHTRENSYAFRLLLAEETGQMACRNNFRVSLDYTFSRGSPLERIRTSELKEYIFGSMVRATESLLENDKFRTIPNSDFVLITRIFRFEDFPNRFSISLCIPNSLFSVVSEIWQDITRWLTQTQTIVLGYLERKNSLKKHHEGAFLPLDYSAAFPKDVDKAVQSLQRKLLPCFRSYSEIPRLFLYPDYSIDFVNTWFKDVFSWLEIKDGPKLNFLSTLLASVVLYFKTSLLQSKSTRVVLLSGNMVVANKLIFLVSGILEPRCRAKLDHLITKEEPQFADDHLQPERQKFEYDKHAADVHDDITVTSENSPSSINSKYHTTTKGWEIPKKSTSLRSVSISSDSSGAEVIQPSSLKSGSSSFKYLSSSLSSQPGSYGSWFNKRPTFHDYSSQSPTGGKGNDSWERIPTTLTLNGPLQRTTSSTSLHQVFGRPSGGPSNQTPQQSPSISEYDEYPWFGTPESPRIDSFYSANKKRMPYDVPLKEFNIERDCQKVKQSDLISQAFDSICKSSDSKKDMPDGCEISRENNMSAPVFDVNIDDPHCRDGFLETLPLYTSYLTHFNYWFQVQSIPITPDCDQQIVSAMKRDLMTELFSMTLVVSLRTREIRKLIMKRDVDSEPGCGIKQKNKKIFNNGKYGKISPQFSACISFMDGSFKAAKLVYESKNIDESYRNKRILEIFSSIINYS